MALPELGPHVRQTLMTRFGSLSVAADRLGISYERLKKAIQRNRFNAADLDVMLPGSDHDELKTQFQFSFSRRAAAQDHEDARRLDFSLFEKLEPGVRGFQRGVRDMDLSAFVSDLYDKIGLETGVQAMTLFCHATSEPEEWKPEQIQLLKQLAGAIDSPRGATILYVMEIDLENTVAVPEAEVRDNVDKKFERHLDRLRTLCDNPNGLVALLRVPRCSFCIPFQKPGLFSRYSADDVLPEHYAFTTVDIPERLDGTGSLGVAVLPQRDKVAYAMRDYMFDLVAHVQGYESDPDKYPFYFTSYPKLSPTELLAKLKPIADL